MAFVMATVRRPVSILLSGVTALLLLFMPVTASASPSLAQRDARQEILDLRDEAATAKKQGWVLLGAAVVVAVIGVVATVATGGAAAPAVVSGVISLASGGLGVERFVASKTATRKANYLEEKYRTLYGVDP